MSILHNIREINLNHKTINNIQTKPINKSEWKQSNRTKSTWNASSIPSMNALSNLVLSENDIYNQMLLNGTYYFDDEIKLTATIPPELENWDVIKTFHEIYYGFQAVLMEHGISTHVVLLDAENKHNKLFITDKITNIYDNNESYDVWLYDYDINMNTSETINDVMLSSSFDVSKVTNTQIRFVCDFGSTVHLNYNAYEVFNTMLHIYPYCDDIMLNNVLTSLSEILAGLSWSYNNQTLKIDMIQMNQLAIRTMVGICDLTIIFDEIERIFKATETTFNTNIYQYINDTTFKNEYGIDISTTTLIDIINSHPSEKYLIYNSSATQTMLNHVSELLGINSPNVFYGVGTNNTINFDVSNIWISDAGYGGDTTTTDVENMFIDYYTSSTENILMFQNNTTIKTVCGRANGIFMYEFYNCSALETVDFPECIIIQGRSFSDCVSLVNINFPKCENIKAQAFTGCTSLIQVNFPKCTKLYNNAFNNCSKLQIANFPICENVSTSTFANCVELTEVVFPKCQKIEESGFIHCEKLLTVDFPNCTSIGNYAFNYCFNLNHVDFSNCTSIGQYAFQECENLQSLNFPKCNNIGYGTFTNCFSLLNANIPNVTTVEGYTFNNCRNMLNVNCPNCETLSIGMFNRCNSLLDVNCENCTIVEGNVFNDCKKIERIVLPNASIFNSQNTFYGCTSLTFAVLPKCVNLVNSMFDCSESTMKLQCLLLGGQINTVSTSAFSATISHLNIYFNTSNSSIATNSKNKFSSFNNITFYRLNNETLTNDDYYSKDLFTKPNRWVIV